MPLDFTLVPIPIAGGLDQSVDERVLPIGALVTAENAWFDKAGAVRKRNGFAKFTSTMVDGSSAVPMNYARTLFSTGNELCMIGRRRLYAYDAESDGWHDRGPVSPFCAEQRDIFRSTTAYRLADVDTHDGYVFYCAERIRYALDDPAAAGYYEMSIEYRIESINDNAVVWPTTVVAVNTAASLRPHGPRVCHASGQLFALWIVGQNTVGTANTLWIGTTWATATPAWPPGAAAWTISTNLYNSGAPQRPYDAIAITSPNWVVAYINQTAQSCTIEKRNAAFAITVSRTLNAAQYEKVTLALGAGGEIYVVLVSRTGGGFPNRNVEIWKLNDDATLSIAYGPQVLYTVVATTEDVLEIGCVHYSAGTVVAVAWTGILAAGIVKDQLHSISARDTTGTVVDAHLVSYNAGVISRPFVNTGRAYVVGRSNVEVELFEYGTVYDLGIGDSSRLHQVCGAYDIGLASTGNEMSVSGSANNVVGPGLWRLGASSAGYRTMIPVLAFYLSGQERQYAQACAVLDFTATPEAATVPGGGVVIGGGMCSWYAGARTEELGFATAPVVAAATLFNAAFSGPAAGTYSYQFVWECQDELGYWHRSIPSTALSVVCSGAAAPYWTFLTMPASHRFAAGNSGRDAQVVAYRAGASGVFYRVTPPMRVVINTRTAASTASFIDIGYTAGAPLYTDAGIELESSQPEGAQFVTAMGERVWLAGFWTRNRAQYSKRMVPATSAEVMVAPEFHEAFGRLLPAGERVAGFAQLDGSAVAFTDRGTYLMAGYGPAADGSNDDFSPWTQISSHGCVDHRSISNTPDGVVFQSAQGLMLLDRAHQVSWISEAVVDVLASYPTVTSAVHLPARTQVRWTLLDSAATAGVILVYDYSTKAWATWLPKKQSGGGGSQLALVTACLHNGRYYAAESNAQVWRESLTDWRDDVVAGTPATYVYVSLTITTAWLSAPTGPGGWKRVRYVVATAERKDAHKLWLEVAHDFESSFGEAYSWTNAVVAAWPATPREQPKVRLKRQKCQAVRIKLYDAADATTAPTTGEGFSLAGVLVELGMRRGTVKTGSQQKG